MFTEEIPATAYEAHVFLANAFWHIHASGKASSDALGIINDARERLRDAERAA